MVKYIIKRLLNGLIVLLGVVTITFFITRVVPSDVAGKWAGERATEEQRKQAIAELGLDKPLVTQYVNYLKDLLSGDLGRSLRTKELITKELASYFPATMELVLVAFLFAMFVGIPMGIYSAKKNGKMLDHATRFFSIGAVSLPTFWVAMVFQLVFYRLLNWLPLGGRISISASLLYDVPNVTGMLILDCILTGSWGLLGDAFVHIIMPGFTIALYPIGLVARMTRSALLEILNEDYMYARVKRNDDIRNKIKYYIEYCRDNCNTHNCRIIQRSNRFADVASQPRPTENCFRKECIGQRISHGQRNNRCGSTQGVLQRIAPKHLAFPYTVGFCGGYM